MLRGHTCRWLGKNTLSYSPPRNKWSRKTRQTSSNCNFFFTRSEYVLRYRTVENVLFMVAWVPDWIQLHDRIPTWPICMEMIESSRTLLKCQDLKGQVQELSLFFKSSFFTGKKFHGRHDLKREFSVIHLSLSFLSFYCWKSVSPTKKFS